MLTEIFLNGLAGAFLALLFRTTDTVKRWMLRGVKPWACDLCLSFWTTAFVYAFATFAVEGHQPVGSIAAWYRTVAGTGKFLGASALVAMLVLRATELLSHPRLPPPLDPPDLDPDLG